MLADTVFAKADPAAIRTDPFPHLVIDDALPEDRLHALLAAVPTPEAGFSRPATRIALEARLLTTMIFIDPVWAAFAERHSRPDVTRAVAALFADHWPAHLSDLDLDGARYGLLNGDGAQGADILTDARLEVITPNPKAPAAHRAQHLDGAQRLFSALFYLRDPADEGAGGGLTLFRFRGARPARAEDLNLLPEDSVEPVRTIPYRANRLVVFPNRPDAIHGAEIRAPNPLPRRYVFITAETPQALY